MSPPTIKIKDEKYKYFLAKTYAHAHTQTHTYIHTHTYTHTHIHTQLRSYGGGVDDDMKGEGMMIWRGSGEREWWIMKRGVVDDMEGKWLIVD